jgi:Ca2+-binding RTX toxin-like protein
MAVPVLLGAPVALTTNTAGRDDYGTVAGLTNGNLATVAIHQAPGTDSMAVTVQVRHGDTLSVLRTIQLNVTSTGRSDLPEVTALASGGFIVTLTGAYSSVTGGRSIWQQAFDATGATVGTPQSLSLAGSATGIGSDAARLTGGGHVVAFEQFTPGGGGIPGSWDVRARLVGADGTLGAVVALNTETGFSETAPQVVGLGDGGFLAIWLRQDVSTAQGPRDQLVFRSFSAAGVPTSPEQVLLQTDRALADIDLARMEGGQLAITWRLVDESTGQNLSQLALLNSSGAVILPGHVAPAPAGVSLPSSVALNDGRLMFTWAEVGAGATITIRGALVSAGGTVSAPFTLVPAVSSSTADHHLTEMADGRVVLTYTVTDAGGRPDTLRQVIDPREARILLTGDAADDAWLGSRFGDVLNGNAGNDRINGAEGADRVNGGLGDDQVRGSTGQDSLRGGAGNDQIWGGAGNDVLTGEAGNDWLRGDSGNDTLTGGPGADTMTGGLGADTFVLTAQIGRDTVTDYLRGTDDLDLGAFNFASLAAAKAAFTQVAGGALLKVGAIEVLITGLDASLLQAGDVIL